MLDILNSMNVTLNEMHSKGMKIGNKPYYKYLDNDFQIEQRKVNPKRKEFYEKVEKWIKNSLMDFSSPSSHQSNKIEMKLLFKF